ncbi:MAG: hypothetical protein ACOX6D_06420 [Thermoguttaceae bacterium]|jgi:hypothetical protein
MNEPPPLSVTAEQAQAYFAGRLYTDRWDSASAEDRQKALAWAASILSASFSWDRSAYADGVWCEGVVALVCEEALWLLTHDPTEPALLAARGFRSASAGPVSVTFDRRAAVALLAPAVERMAVGFTLPHAPGRISSTMLP